VTGVGEVPNPRSHDGWVTDLADVIAPADEAELERVLQSLHVDTGAEVAVVTVDDVADTPKAFATGLFAHWGIGDADANNGLLVLMVIDQRRLEMETGYGLEGLLPDGWLGTMQAQHMVPHFKNGSYGTGLVAGIEQIDARLRRDPEAVRQGAGGRGLPSAAPGAGIEWSTVGLGAGGVGLVGLGVWGWRRRQRALRTCPSCEVLMEALGEAEDDEHLTDGEVFEEQIGSMDYEVLLCPSCDHSKTLAHTRWFSGYHDCSACGHRARTSTSTTVRAATYSSGGLVRVTERCSYCNDTSSYTRSTPRKTRSSSSGGSSSFGGGSSGGSSFGGGRSGGGGAGSSW
jgi:uncharacterized protein